MGNAVVRTVLDIAYGKGQFSTRIEDIAFQNLRRDMPDLRKNKLRQTIWDAVAWGIGSDDLEDAPRLTKPDFVPDATRFRKCCLADDPTEKRPIVEMWEIEDTSRITGEKWDKIMCWWELNLDGEEIPLFEIWVTDRWGNNRNMVWADWRDVYGDGAESFIECPKELIHV